MRLQTNQKKHSSQWMIGDRKLLATVRDPLDHFLSGWAECGSRPQVNRACLHQCPNVFTSSIPYDKKIQNWLSFIQKCSGPGACECRVHSMPQANFLFANDDEYEIDPKLDIVGDLKELPGLLELVGFSYNTSMSIGRNSTENRIKEVDFPNDKSSLSKSTIQNICKYLELDYLLFDFEPPAACRDQIILDIKNMTDSFSDAIL